MLQLCRFLVVLALVYLPALAGAQQAVQPVLEQSRNDGYGVAAALVTQLVFLLVPASVVLQVIALRKLESRRLQLARFSACAMAAVWLFVIVTALAGSNLSPIWLVFLSPLFVLFLALLLFARPGADDDSLPVPPPR